MRIIGVNALLILSLAATPWLLAEGEASGPFARFNFDGDLKPVSGGCQFEVMGSPRFSPGVHGQAVELSKDCRLRLPIPEELKKGEFSIAFWLKPHWHSGDSEPHPIMELDAPQESYEKTGAAAGWAAGQWLFAKGYNRIMPGGLLGPVGNDYVSSAPAAAWGLRPETWMHVVFTYSASGKFKGSYFNGVGARGEAKPDSHTVHKSLWLGGINGHPDFGSSDVAIDDLKIFDRAIDSSEIPAIAGAELPPTPDFQAEGAKCDVANFVKTPHKSWAKPLAGGPLKVLFVGESARMRDCFELIQRMESEPALLTSLVVSKQTLLDGKSFKMVSDGIEAALKNRRPDVVALLTYGWNLLEPSTRAALMAYVKDGGGLVLLPPRCVNTQGANKGHGGLPRFGWRTTADGKEFESLLAPVQGADAAWLIDGTPWTSLGIFQETLASQPPETLFKVGRQGKGRLLTYDLNPGFNYAGLVPYSESFDPLDYDYALKATAKALLWAAGRDGVVQVGRPQFVAENAYFLKPCVSIKGAWNITLTNRTDAEVPVKVELSVHGRGPDAPKVQTQGARLKPGRNEISLGAELDRAGTLFADVRILMEGKDGKVADWGSGVVEVFHGDTKFISVSADRPCHNVGEAPVIRAEVTRGYYNSKAGAVKWRLFDAYGREVARGSAAVDFDKRTKSEAVFALPAMDGRSLINQLLLDFELQGQNRIFDNQSLELRCKAPDDDGKSFKFYAWGGCNSPVSSLVLSQARDKYNLDALGPFGPGRISVDRLEALNRLNLRPWLMTVSLGGRGSDENGVRVHDLADEMANEAILDRVRQDVEKARSYSPLFYSLGDEVMVGDYDAQPSPFENARFRSWLQGKFKTVQDASQALGANWADWKGAALPTKEEAKSGKIDTRLIAERRLFRQWEFNDLVRRCVDAATRIDSTAKCGYEGQFGLLHTWSYTDNQGVGRVSTFSGPYHQSYAGMQWEMLRSFKRPGAMMGCWFNYANYNEGYSRSGPWEALLYGSDALGWFETFDGTWYSMFNPDFTPTFNFKNSSEELKPITEGLGDLVLSARRCDVGVRVLYNYANLDRGLRDFAVSQRIYALLADANVQLDYIGADDVAAGALDAGGVKLLVVAGNSTIDAPVAEAIRRFSSQGGGILGESRPAALAETAKELYLGERLDKYGPNRYNPEGAALREAIAGFAKTCGAVPLCEVKSADGAYRPVAKVDYQDGSDRYALLLRDYRTPDQAPAEFVVDGFGEAEVYDCREGKYLGRSGKATKTLQPARGALLAFLPYRAKGMRLVGARPQCRPGESLNLRPTLDFEGTTPGVGVFRVEVSAPDGALAPALCRNVHALGGVAEFSLRMAYNDQPGKWTVTVRDMATGTIGKAEFELKK